MECPLVLGLADRARFLQQVRLDVGSSNVAGRIKVDADEFALFIVRNAIKSDAHGCEY